MRKALFRQGSMRGFTLIEIMVVISIISVLALIILPNMRRSRARAQLTSCISNLRSMAAGVSAYANDNQGMYPLELAPGNIQVNPNATNAGLLSPYMRMNIRCPGAPGIIYVYNCNTWAQTGPGTSNGTWWQFSHGGGSAHTEMGIGNAYPIWICGSGGQGIQEQ